MGDVDLTGLELALPEMQSGVFILSPSALHEIAIITLNPLSSMIIHYHLPSIIIHHYPLSSTIHKLVIIIVTFLICTFISAAVTLS